MKTTMLGALILFTVACGAYQFPTSPSPHTGTVSGRVIVFPCAPVQPAGSTCAGRPAAGLEIDFVNDKVVQGTVTDQSGHYSILLAPATYQVQFKSYMRVIRGPQSVAVTADSSTVADYVLDSGIRVPLPQQ